MSSRTENALRIFRAGLIAKVLSLILSFISRTFFIRFLGTTYLGINGLYTEILAVLSFTELGFGTAINYFFYQYVAENNELKIKQLICFFKKVYFYIACIITILGILLLPFLKFLIKGDHNLSNQELQLYFFIFLANTVLGYFVTYKYGYVNAIQKTDILTFIQLFTDIAIIIIQIIILYITKNYLCYLIAHVGTIILSRFIISLYLNIKFPIVKVKNEEKLSLLERQKIFREVKSLAIHRFSSIAVHSTDNIIISSLNNLGIIIVGILSNYYLIINSVTGFISIFFNSILPGLGNLYASSSKKDFYSVFQVINYLGFWIYGFCSIAFYVLLSPFIKIWIGDQNLVDDISIFLIVINCYLLGISTIYNIMRITTGRFQLDMWVAFIQAIVNLIISIILAPYYGLIGIFIGTIISRLVILILRPFYTYNNIFKRPVCNFYIKNILYFFIVLISGAVTWLLTKGILENISISNFIYSCLIVAIIPNLIFLSFTWKSTEAKITYTKITSYFFLKEK